MEIMVQYIIRLFFFTVLAFFATGCSESENSLTGGGWIEGLTTDVEFPMEGGTQNYEFSLAGGLDASQMACVIPSKDNSWCEVVISGNQLTLYVYRSYADSDRFTTVTLEYGEEYSFVIRVKQEAGISEDDIKIPVMAGTADTENDGNEMDKSFDGDYKTYFNSKGGINVVSTFRMTYTLESGHTLYRIVYTPRTDSGNKWGSFNKFDVEVATEDNPAKFVQVASFERGDGVHTPLDFYLDQPVANAKYVRFSVHSAYQQRVSCAEMEFYEPSSNQFDYESIFADRLYTSLKSGVTELQIKNMPDNPMRSLALDLFNRTYETKYRLADYRPYQHPSVIASYNRTSSYSLSDNPTGIFVEVGEKLFVALGETYQGAEISLLIRDLNGGYGNSQTYSLKQGLNEIVPAVGGLVYVLNNVEEEIPLLLESEEDKQEAAAKTVTVHIISGEVNGYYDCQKNTLEEWPEILANAKYQDLDILGNYAHITWRTSDFIKYNTDIETVLENYDRLVWLQEEFMGLVKYNRMFNNRMHFSIDYQAKSPNASSYRAVYTPGYAEVLCDQNRFETRLWGPAHEVGHCNQTRPGLKWAGTTEVTNNIMSLYVQASFGQPCKLLVDEQGGMPIYAYAQQQIVKKKNPHTTTVASNEARLVPFWQLKLYMMDVLGKKDFYHDLYEYYRNYDYEALEADKYTDGVYQLDFVRQVCRISGLNMLDFFEKWGFLTPVDTELNDYGTKKFTVTESQITALEEEISKEGYAMPHKDVHLIQEDNLHNYQ